MKLKSIVLSLILIPTILNSQKIVSLDNIWTYFIDVDGTGPNGISLGYTEVFTLDSQLIIFDNKEYHEVILHNSDIILDSCYVGNYNPTHHFVREDSIGRVYMRDSFSNESLIYDFTLEVNDIFYNEITNESIILLEKDSIEINDGSMRERFIFDNGEVWVEGAGSSDKLFNIFLEDMFGLCYINNCEVLHFTSDQVQCHVTPVSTKDINNVDSKIKVYPNPTYSEVKIELSDENNYELKLYNVDGKLMLVERAKTNTLFTIDISQFKDGIYFLKIGETVKKIVKLK